jgi:acyl-CoA thioester hydrolase
VAAVADRSVDGVEVLRGTVPDEWIDVNDHMNVASYLAAFDLAVVAFRERLGVTDDYVESGRSTFAVECHMTWQRELLRDEPYLITTQVLGYSRAGLHQFNRMYHATELFLVATAESMTLHVDLERRTVVSWPDSVLDRLAAFAAQQRGLSRPEQAGRGIEIRNPIYAME